LLTIVCFLARKKEEWYPSFEKKFIPVAGRKRLQILLNNALVKFHQEKHMAGACMALTFHLTGRLVDQQILHRPVRRR
jgi:hypothetical protein